ncbi:MAG TPA: hypothetical protein VH835_17960 [Dongiaceae bacterium]|jgi:hypothetical protein
MAMDREELSAALSLWLTEMDGEVEDRHEAFQRLESILGQMRAMGMPIPQDLADLEAELAEEFAAEGEGAPEDPEIKPA